MCSALVYGKSAKIPAIIDKCHHNQHVVECGGTRAVHAYDSVLAPLQRQGPSFPPCLSEGFVDLSHTETPE